MTHQPRLRVKTADNCDKLLKTTRRLPLSVSTASGVGWGVPLLSQTLAERALPHFIDLRWQP